MVEPVVEHFGEVEPRLLQLVADGECVPVSTPMRGRGAGAFTARPRELAERSLERLRVRSRRRAVHPDVGVTVGIGDDGRLSDGEAAFRSGSNIRACWADQ